MTPPLQNVVVLTRETHEELVADQHLLRVLQTCGLTEWERWPEAYAKFVAAYPTPHRASLLSGRQEDQR